MLEKSEKMGRKKMGRPFESPRSPVDFQRVCDVLGFGDIPPNLTETSLIDLFNNHTNYYLPRIEDKDKPLLTISKPLEDREEELELWREVGILS